MENIQLALLTPEQELEAAKSCPDGAWLSPAAQALYEEEGRSRFARYHRIRATLSALDDRETA